MIQFEMPRQQRYQLVADDESDMPEWAEEYTICNLRSGPDPGPYMFCGGEWVMLSSYAVRDGTLKIYHDVKAGDQPWDGDASEVREVVIADTVRSIGAGAFASLENLEYVSIPAGVTVEDGAFSQTFKDPFDADIAMADVAGYEYVAYEGVMYQCDPEIFTYSGAAITGLASGASGAKILVLPNVHSDTAITSTASQAFKDNTTITKVLVLPNSTITSISGSTFSGCTSLVDVRFSDVLENINGSAFVTTGIVEAVFPDTLKTIGGYVFNGCGSLSVVAFPSSLQSIDTAAFVNCTGVTEVSFKEGFAPTLGNGCFGAWTFYAADGTTVVDKTVASNLAGKTFKGSASRLVEDAGPVPGMEGRYMYAITTDSAGMNILSVQAAHDGRPLDTVVTASTRRQGAENIPHEWDFVNGVGPFKCWYGAFNIQDYVAGTESEAPVCTGAGMLAYRLDPYDLGRTMAGTTLQGTYNVFLVVPTVYWKAVGNILYLSDDSSYAGITGMTAYAHTATSDGTSSVYPFIGIGVYESSVSGTAMVSASGKTALANKTNSEFKALADALTPAGSSDFQMWNFFQWTLFKIMCYAVMGAKNSQWKMGNGPVSGSAAQPTGLSNMAGPFASSTSDYSKMYIEDPWGNMSEMVGDTMLTDCLLKAGNSLGGAETGTQASTGVYAYDSSGRWVWVTSCSIASSTWDLPAGGQTGAVTDVSTISGDYYLSSSGDQQVVVGGEYNRGESAGLAYMAYQPLTLHQWVVGARLSAFFDGTAMGTPEVTTKAAPAPTRSTEEDLPEAERDEPAEEPAEEPVEEPVEEEPAEEPVEEPVEESDEGTMDIEGL